MVKIYKPRLKYLTPKEVTISKIKKNIRTQKCEEYFDLYMSSLVSNRGEEDKISPELQVQLIDCMAERVRLLYYRYINIFIYTYL